MIRAEFIIVGSGLTGSVIARQLADAGRKVVVLERRGIIGGNVVDAIHEPSGIRYGVHGVHYFRTSSDRIWEFVTRFADFFPHEARVLTSIDGELVPWPLQRSYIERLCGKDWESQLKTPFQLKPANFEEACLSLMPRLIYEKAVKCYSEKQWDKPCTELSASLCKRFDVRDGEDRLTPHARYQGIPRAGYSAWMQQMLDGIPVITDFDYLKRRHEVEARKCLVFTGPIDEYFNFRLGRLEYRAQRRFHLHLTFPVPLYPVAQVNTPQHDAGKQIRAIEWRHLMPTTLGMCGTVITTETPYSPTDPDKYEYPMQDESNARLYMAYRGLARAEEKTLFCGRLGSFKYLDMDQAVGAALKIADRLLAE